MTSFAGLVSIREGTDLMPSTGVVPIAAND